MSIQQQQRQQQQSFYPHAPCVHMPHASIMITTPIMGDFLLAQRGSDIPIPRTPAQGGLANTSSEEPRNTPLGRHIAFEIPSPAPCFAEGEEEEEDGDDENGGTNTGTEGEEEGGGGGGGGGGPRRKRGRGRRQEEGVRGRTRDEEEETAAAAAGKKLRSPNGGKINESIQCFLYSNPRHFWNPSRIRILVPKTFRSPNGRKILGINTFLVFKS